MLGKTLFQWFLYLGISLGMLQAACTSDPEQDNNPPDEVEIGATSFVSADQGADGYAGGDKDVNMDDEAEADGDADGDSRTVQEGDIYRVRAGGDIVFNLNSYRGLQVIDISDIEHPAVVGALRLSGYPVEMYVTDDRVYMLLNNWHAYWGNRKDVAVDAYNGGVIVSADISDLAHPKELGRALVPGYIQTSRLIGNETDKALYVAASNWNASAETVVKSFYLEDDGTIEDRTTLSLGGYVQDIQATPDALMVARTDYTSSNYHSSVSVVDVSSPNGDMIEGAEVQLSGIVTSKTNMDIKGDIMRIVSGAGWSNTDENYLETFDISDIQAPKPVDKAAFGEGEQLYATLFLGNKAFFVTYFRTDPFHAFEIDDTGLAEEKVEYVISGWNNFFKPVFDDTRILGVGSNDETATKTAVSLYDITDLANPNPFIARQEVSTADYSWSEAAWDDRAFSVIENAVSVAAPDGTLETGLVLLPFSGYDRETWRGEYAVQIFTFSQDTLTRRGLLSHGSPVRRAFRPEEDVTAALSEQELSLHDTSNPDLPVEAGRVELAPSYDDLLVFGDLGVRVKRNLGQEYYYWYDITAENKTGTTLETVSLSNPETTDVKATVEVGARADVIQVGDLAVAMTRFLKSESATSYSTRFQVFDYADPTAPEELSSFETDAPIDSGRGYYLDYDCAMWGYYSNLSPLKVDNALVFPSYTFKEEQIGKETRCDGYYNNDTECYDEDWTPRPGCEWKNMSKTCLAADDEPPACTESAVKCVFDEDGISTCTEMEFDPSLVTMHCRTYDAYRYWDVASLHVLDLSDPAHPALSEKIATAENEEAAGMIARGNSIYLTHKIPYDVPDDSKTYARYYFRELNLDDPSAPDLGAPVNIPGVLRDVAGDKLYTEESTYWGSEQVTAINYLRRTVDGKAELLARKRFDDRYVHTFVTDKDGHALVVHGPNDDYYYGGGIEVDDVAQADAIGRASRALVDENSDMNTLTVLDMNDNMSEMSNTPIDTWASLKTVKNEKALFQVEGGILLVNLENPAAPAAQAYFPVLGWPQSVFLHDDTIYLPSGPYGIYTFDADSFNLMK